MDVREATCWQRQVGLVGSVTIVASSTNERQAKEISLYLSTLEN